MKLVHHFRQNQIQVCIFKMGIDILIRFQKHLMSTKSDQMALRYRCTNYEFVYFLIFLTKIEYESSSPFPIKSDSGLDFQKNLDILICFKNNLTSTKSDQMALRYRCTKFEFVYFLIFLTKIEYDSSSPFPIKSYLGLDFQNSHRYFDQLS